MGKKKAEVRSFFEDAFRFIEKHQSKDTIISAMVHMDERTPHMHLSFVPLTPDKRLSAKDIAGNKKKLTWWQDGFWKHMVRKYPDLERGESASEIGRTHIPPRLFKEAAHLNRQRDMLMKLLGEVNALNAKKKSAEIERENIPMAGREQKAHEGKWNGGFAPYGYRLENGEMLIAEDEVEAIRAIYDRYIHTNDGASGVARYLNSHGYTKKLRQNGAIPGFSADFVKDVLDNPVYMGTFLRLIVRTRRPDTAITAKIQSLQLDIVVLSVLI